MVSVKQIPGAMGLNKEQLLDLYYKMFLARTVGQRERMLNRMGKGPFAVTGEGHEAAQVGTAYALTPGKDWALPYYRDIGVALTLGMTPADLLKAHLARGDSIESGGRNMPSHFSSPALRIVSGSAPVATQFPHAVGVALAARLRGLDEVVITYVGDGGTSVGDVHEAMNFAAVFQVPVVFLCQNNQWAISVPYKRQTAAATKEVPKSFQCTSFMRTPRESSMRGIAASPIIFMGAWIVSGRWVPVRPRPAPMAVACS